jgi:hypothetical protein
MKVSDSSSNGAVSEKRVSVTSSAGSPANQASASDNSATNMNTPELKERGFRADQLIDMAGDDSYRLATEAPRKTKMKG